MTQEEKDIIYRDACGRILYKPYAAYEFEGELIQVQITGMEGEEPTRSFYGYSFDTWGHIPHDNVKLYLRPMSSMTKEEEDELDKKDKESSRIFFDDLFERKKKEGKENLKGFVPDYPTLDWLNQHHFDYRDLIKKGLALEAPKDMYKL